jgi:hypothetical protein
LPNDVIGDGISLVFGQPFFQTTYDLAGPAKCVGGHVPQHLDAYYQVVKVEAGPETNDRELGCRSCSAPLAGREGNFALKYFLLRKGIRARRRA